MALGIRWDPLASCSNVLLMKCNRANSGHHSLSNCNASATGRRGRRRNGVEVVVVTSDVHRLAVAAERRRRGHTATGWEAPDLAACNCIDGVEEKQHWLSFLSLLFLISKCPRYREEGENCHHDNPLSLIVLNAKNILLYSRC